MKNKKIILIILLVIVLVAVLVVRQIFFSDKYDNTILYNGKKYVYLECNMDIFNYEFNSNNYYEEDMIHPVYHDKWDMIYFNGDLFVVNKQVKDDIKYYADDSNYEWSFVLDVEDSEVSFPISISKEELKYIYNMENVKRDETMLFDDIKAFASITKTSKDKTIYAIICLAYYKDSWYWRTEIIDDTKENDPEYVIKLPKSLNEKLFKLLNKEKFNL